MKEILIHTVFQFTKDTDQLKFEIYFEPFPFAERAYLFIKYQ